MDRTKGKQQKPEKKPKRKSRSESEGKHKKPRTQQTELLKTTLEKTIKTQPDPTPTAPSKSGTTTRSYRPQKRSRTIPTRRLKTRSRKQKSTADTPKTVAINYSNYYSNSIKNLTETADRRADQTFGTILLYLNTLETRTPGLRAGVG